VAQFWLTPRARSGLAEILEYAAREFGPRVASDFLERIVDAFDTIAANPGIGRVREDITLDRSIRFFVTGPSLIAYRRGENGDVELLFLEPGERDWERLLDRED